MIHSRSFVIGQFQVSQLFKFFFCRAACPTVELAEEAFLPHLIRSVVAGGAGGTCPHSVGNSEISEIQKFLGNSLSVWLSAITRCLSFHSFKLHSYIVETNHSI